MSAFPLRRGVRDDEAASRPRRRGLRVPLPLALLLAAALLNVFLWSYATPPLQGPDESAHMAYLQHLAETGAPPDRNGNDFHVYSTEQSLAMAIGALNTLPTVGNARPSWSPADERELKRLSDDLPDAARENGIGPNPAAQNPPLYYAYGALPYLAGKALGFDFFGRVMLVRWATGLLYVATVALTWLFVSQLLRATWLRVTATGIVALIPQLAFIGAIVNPDILLVALWTGFLALATRTLLAGPSGARIAGLGALAGASSLTHGRGLLLIVPVAVAVGLACRRHGVPLVTSARWSAIGAAVAAAGALAALLATRASSGGAAFGGVASVGGAGISPTGFAAYLWNFYLRPLFELDSGVGPDYGFRQVWVETFFGRFGSLDASFSSRVYTGLTLVVLGGIAAFACAAWVRRRWVAGNWQLAVTLLSVPVVLLGGLHVIAYRQLANGSLDPVLQGRYLLPCAALAGLAGAAICATLPRRLGAAAAGALLAFGVMLSIGGIGISVARFYL